MNTDRLSPNFTRDEFACKCGCGFDDVDPKLIVALQKLRDIIAAPIHVNSGCRCRKHNAAQPGHSPRSQHLLGRAADVVVHGLSPAMVAGIAEAVPEFDNGGIGIYGTFTHLDVRGVRARWTL